MSKLEIRPISLPRDAATFVKSWWSIYEGDAMWVPPLIGERKAFFDPKKNPYHQHADIQCFMAYRDGRAVGTISAQVDKPYQDIEKPTGGKVSSCLSLTETPATTTSGRARNRPTTTK